MAVVERLEQQHRIGHDPRTVGLAPVTVAQMQLATSPRAAWITLATNYDPTMARLAWRELTTPTAASVRPVGQSVSTMSRLLPSAAYEANASGLQSQNETIDTLLASCPTDAEMLAIRRDFNIVFDVGTISPSMTSWSCTPGGSESGIMLSIYNAFRAMKLLTFNVPLPLIGATNLYDWLKSLGLNIHITSGEAVSHEGGVRDIYLRSETMATPDNRQWLNHQTGDGLSSLVALIVHEARHTLPVGGSPHDCGVNDSTLAYGGAWALQYYFYLWLGNHSGLRLSDYEKQSATQYASYLASTRFCDPPFQPRGGDPTGTGISTSTVTAPDLSRVDLRAGASPRPAGQAVPPSPSVPWLVPLGLAAVAGALFAATVWWVPRAAASR